MCDSATGTVLWGVLFPQPFNFAGANGSGVETKVITNMSAFLPVYDSLEEALNEWPAAQVFPFGTDTGDCSCGAN